MFGDDFEEERGATSLHCHPKTTSSSKLNWILLFLVYCANLYSRILLPDSYFLLFSVLNSILLHFFFFSLFEFHSSIRQNHKPFPCKLHAFPPRNLESPSLNYSVSKFYLSNTFLWMFPLNPPQTLNPPHKTSSNTSLHGPIQPLFQCSLWNLSLHKFLCDYLICSCFYLHTCKVNHERTVIWLIFIFTLTPYL